MQQPLKRTFGSFFVDFLINWGIILATIQLRYIMSGYTSPDQDQEHALIINENALHAARQNMYTTVTASVECTDCGDEIPAARRKALPGVFQCIACRNEYERTYRPQKIKMLDRVL